MTPTTTIRSNGSRWAGEAPASIAELLEVLKEHPLDRTFEAFGNFAEIDPENIYGEKLLPPGGVSFFGNFYTVSHVFNIDTTDPEIIRPLTAAIRANQLRADYLAQPTYAQQQAVRAAERAAHDAKRKAERERRARQILGL